MDPEYVEYRRLIDDADAAWKAADEARKIAAKASQALKDYALEMFEKTIAQAASRSEKLEVKSAVRTESGELERLQTTEASRCPG